MSPGEFAALPHGLRIGMNRSPLRDGDRNPSFSIFVYEGKVFWKDWATGERGTAEALMERLNVSVGASSGLTTKTDTDDRREYSFVEREWRQEDLDYWGRFSVSEKLLRFYEVAPLAWLGFGTGSVYWDTKSSPAYVYKLYNEILQKWEYKFYQPFGSSFKFRSSARAYNLMGLKQFKRMAPLCRDMFWNTLIVTKGQKDVMALASLRILSVAVHSETVRWEAIRGAVLPLMAETERKNLVFLFDNDPPGIKGAQALAQASNGRSNALPEDSQAKDPAELIERLREKAKTEIGKAVACAVGFGPGSGNP